MYVYVELLGVLPLFSILRVAHTSGGSLFCFVALQYSHSGVNSFAI